MCLREESLNKIKQYLINFRVNISILIIYSILSFILTYPSLIIKNEIPSDGADTFHFLWLFWWFKEALWSLSSPYYTTYIYYPPGVSLAFDTVTPLNSIISIPLQSAIGLVNAYKTIWITTFILSGYGTFLLAKYLISDTKSAFISGIIFMFCPYRLVHALAHINLISTQWIPFYILFFIKIFDKKRPSDALLAAIFLFLTTISCYYYSIFLLVFTLIYIVHKFWSDKHILDVEIIKQLSMMTILFVIIVFPFIYPLLNELFNFESNYMYAGGFGEFSADLLAFFLPSMFHPLFKEYTSPIYHNFTGIYIEQVVYIGYTVLILSLLAIKTMSVTKIRFWAVSAFVFAILCLGPKLNINGSSIFLINSYEITILLPYYILEKVPIFSIARCPSRWSIMVMLSLSILAGYGSLHISEKYFKNNKNILSNIVFLILSALVIFEFLMMPFPMFTSEIPEFYGQISEDVEDYVILEIPNQYPNISYADYMYYQTVHGKKLVNGHVARTPDYATIFLNTDPFIKKLLKNRPLTEQNNELIQNIIRNDTETLNYYNIRYIIVHQDRIDLEYLNYINHTLQSVPAEIIIFKNDSMIVYKLAETRA